MKKNYTSLSQLVQKIMIARDTACMNSETIILVRVPVDQVDIQKG